MYIQITRKNQGFTLIELMVVIAIIGLLASTVLTNLQTARQRSLDSQRISEARELMKALELYRTNNGGYPCSGPTTMVSLNCNTGTTGGAATANIKLGSSGTHTAGDNLLRSTLGFSPSRDAAVTGAIIQYRVAGTTDNDPNRSGYTISVWQQRLNNYCEINAGTGHTAVAYASCGVSAI